MIRIYGTSHVSQDSIELIDDVMKQNPDKVALELDAKRLHALKSGDKTDPDTLFLRLLQRLQNRIGEKTGLMPGREMLHAYEKAVEQQADVALIDRDITHTFQALKTVPRMEKVKAAVSMVVALLLPFGSLDVSKIPEDEEIDQMVEQMKKSYPCIYRVLMEERNTTLALNLAEIQRRNPEAYIVAFVGAAHKKPVETILKAEGYAVGSQSSLAEFQ